MRYISSTAQKFRSILGINTRELEFVSRLNPKERILAVAVSKIRTKALLAAHGVPVPATYAVIRTRTEFRSFTWDVPDEFALKPSGGGRGCGIVVTVGRQGDGWCMVDGQPISRRALTFHILDILDGAFSREGRPDEAHFEQRLRCSRDITGSEPTGLPDIRVIVCYAQPILAMMRLPTRASHGKANLHQGAVGVGIDLARGVTIHAVHHGKRCTLHPDTNHPLIGIPLPQWSKIMDLAVQAAAVSGLGYTGIDLVLDDTLGPVVLEVNARPGLDIQIANLAGLYGRLQTAAVSAPEGGPLERV